MSKRRSDMTKDDYIKAEIKRLRGLFRDLPKDAAAIAEKLIENAAFMAVSLRELQEIINEKGYIEEYQNGANQSGVKKSSEVEVYNTMIKNFNVTMKQLIDLMPAAEGVKVSNPVMDYITRKAT